MDLFFIPVCILGPKILRQEVSPPFDVKTE